MGGVEGVGVGGDDVVVVSAGVLAGGVTEERVKENVDKDGNEGRTYSTNARRTN